MLELNSKGLVKQRESEALEFKESFGLGDSLIEYSRTLVGMANNQGGHIAFGIKNKPHIPTGLKDERFDSLDPKSLNKVFLEYYSSDVSWNLSVIELSGKRIGLISVDEASRKPIICSKNHTGKHLREGAVYFRYRGETKEIRHGELANLLEAEREKEKLLWMKHIQSIASIGPQSVQILNSLEGSLSIGQTKVLLDKNLLGQLKVINEGKLSETDGAPTLRVVGEIVGLVNHDTVIYNDTSYPYTSGMLCEKLGINSWDCQALLFYLKIKGNPEYHAEIQTGKSSKTQKYSDLALGLFRDKMRGDPNLIQIARDSYRHDNMSKIKNGKKKPKKK